MAIFANVEGQWKEIAGPKANNKPPRAYDGASGTWVDARAIYAKVQSDWKLIWPPLGTIVTVNPPTGTVYAGNTVTVTGIVSPASGPADAELFKSTFGLDERAVPAGTVVITHSASASGPWAEPKTVSVGVDGSFSTTYTINTAGARVWRAAYTTTNPSFFVDSVGTSAPITFQLQQVTGLTGGTLTYTTADMTWTAVTGATSYEIYRNSASHKTATTTSFSDTGLGNDTSYTYTVRAKATPASGTVLGAFSAGKTANMGHPLDQPSNSVNYNQNPVATGTYQRNGVSGGNAGSWINGTNGRIICSHCNNGNYQQYGFMQYNLQAFKDWLAANYGSDVYPNLSYNSCYVYMSRVPGVSCSPAGAVKMTWYWSDTKVGVGTTWPGGGTPAGVAAPYEINGLSPGTAGWMGIHSGFGAAIFRDGHPSLFLKSNFFDQYAQYYGLSEGGSHGQIQIGISWNFVRRYAQASTWT